MIHLFCIWNRNEVLQKMLISSIKNQIADYELHLIDNSDNRYASAAIAYNEEVGKSQLQHDDCLVFLHQDIGFIESNTLLNFEKQLKENPNTILGLAGMPVDGKTISNLKYMNNGEYITATRLSEIKEVESLDECFFAMSYNLFNKIKFDNQVCFHWHLYAVDICLQAKTQYNSNVCVLPNEAYHKLKGDDKNSLQTDNYFLRTMYRLIRKHRKNYSVIYTPCYIINTMPMLAISKLFRSAVKNLIN